MKYHDRIMNVQNGMSDEHLEQLPHGARIAYRMGHRDARHAAAEIAAEADRRILLLQNALSELCDLQNGPPLPKYESQWQGCMNRARALLEEQR